MQKWRPWETASEADWALASQREPVIRLLAQQERLTGESTQQAMIQLGVSRSVLYKLVRRYRQRPQASSLLPWKRGRDSKTRLLKPDRESLLQSCIREVYLTRERPSIGALTRAIRLCFFEQRLPAPDYRTVRRRLNALARNIGRSICIDLSCDLPEPRPINAKLSDSFADAFVRLCIFQMMDLALLRQSLLTLPSRQLLLHRFPDSQLVRAVSG